MWPVISLPSLQGVFGCLLIRLQSDLFCRAYILDLVKKVKKSGCNVLIVQKSILREAVNDMSLHFLAKMKILTVIDVEREDIDFYCKSLGCKPIASIDHMTPEMLGSAELVEEVQAGASKIVKV